MNSEFTNETTRIYYDDTIPGLVQVWRGFASGEPLRTAHEAFLRLQRRFRTAKSLSDLREMRVIPRLDQQWIEAEFFPRALAANYRTVAIVASTDAFNQTSVRNILLHLAGQGGFRAELFTDETAARAWLREQEA